MIFFKKRPILTHIILLGVFIGAWILFDLLGMSAWYTINNIASPFYPDTIRYASFFSGFAWGLVGCIVAQFILVGRTIRIKANWYLKLLASISIAFIIFDVVRLSLLILIPLRPIVSMFALEVAQTSFYFSIIASLSLILIIRDCIYNPTYYTKSTSKKSPWILFLKRIFIVDFLSGLMQTGKTLFKKKKTIQFPEEKMPVSPRFRGLLALRRYPNGEERCIACKLCEAVCPALAITIEAKTRKDGSRRTTRFDIDMFKCINCGLCEEACPVDSIVVTSEHHYVVRKRGENILTKEKLLAIGDMCEPKIAQSRAEDEPYR